MSHLVGLAAASSVTHSSAGILDPIAKPIAGVLAAFYSVIPNYGIAIILLSIAWMVIISPLTLKTTRSMLAMQKLQPQLKKLQEQHKNDRQAFAQAQMELFREHNVSPFGSCLPSILPLPVFIALFRVINGLSHHSAGVAAPKYLASHTRMYHDIVAAGGHLNAFGLDLSSNALAGHATFFTALPFYILLLAMGGTQYYQTVQMMSRNPAAQQNSQARVMKFLPLIFVFFCARFPAGVVLYYAMSNVCRIAQQAAMYRFDPKVKSLAAQEVMEVEAKTREIDNRKGPKAGFQSGSGNRSPSAADGPRSRFRDLLAGAAEQQAQAKAAKALGNAKAPGNAKNPTGATKAKAGSPASEVKGSVPVKKQTLPKPVANQAPIDRTGTAGNGKTGGSSALGGGANGALRATQPGADGSGTRPESTGGAGASGRTGAQGRRTNKKRRGR